MRVGQRGLLLLDRRSVQATVRCTMLFVAFAVAYPDNVLAQFSQAADRAVRVGDRWVYDTRDEMTGYPAGTDTKIVMELSLEEAVMDVRSSGSAASMFVTYDLDWNCIDNLVWTFKPSNGGGINLPLAVRKTWGIEFDARSNLTAETFKGSGFSKVVTQKKLTTAVGTFEAFKIEWQVRQFNTADPSKLVETQIVLWYAPQVNHYVRRTAVVKFQERTRAIVSEELADFSRAL